MLHTCIKTILHEILKFTYFRERNILYFVLEFTCVFTRVVLSHLLVYFFYVHYGKVIEIF